MVRLACARLDSRSGCPYTIPTVLETLQTYGAAEDPVNRRLPQDFQMISTSGISGWGGGRRDASKHQALSFRTALSRGICFWLAALEHAQQYVPSVREMTPISTHTDTEDKKLRKDLYCLEVLALKVPFGMCCFPNEVPWPGRLRG
jgi:hypothetical protein